MLTERLQHVFVWPSENWGSGASDHQKKQRRRRRKKKMCITRPRPDGWLKIHKKILLTFAHFIRYKLCSQL